MKTAFETVSVVGLGYVGLPTAALIASRGIQVHGVDVDAETVELINRGQVPIVEPGLDVLVRGAVATGRLGAATTARPADAFIVAVPTPFRRRSPTRPVAPQGGGGGHGAAPGEGQPDRHRIDVAGGGPRTPSPNGWPRRAPI